MAKEPAIEAQAMTVHAGSSTQIIYADRILTFALGPTVSRLNLAIEVGPNAFSTSGTLVIPTSALIDALDHMQKHLHENNEVKNLISQGLEAIKIQYNNL